MGRLGWETIEVLYKIDIVITDNKDKKALVEKLLQDKVITIEDSYLLLDEKEQQGYIPQPYPVYPSWPYQQPLYYGYMLRTTCDSPTYIVDGACVGTFTVSTGTGVITDTYTMN